jgi:hypothetical protein
MKPGSKTRTRRTLDGGTKTVTKSKSSTGAKTRIVEKSKGNFQTGIETTRKVRRADKSGVAKTKSSSFARKGKSGSEENLVFQTKNKFRERGNLISEKRKLNTSRKEINKPSRDVSVAGTVVKNQKGYERRAPGSDYFTTKKRVSEYQNVNDSEKRNKVSNKTIRRVRKAWTNQERVPADTKQNLHQAAASKLAKENKDMSRKSTSSYEGVETGRSYTPSNSANPKRAQREYKRSFTAKMKKQ